MGVDEYIDDDLLVYPNPTSGSVFMKTAIPLNVSDVQVIDMLGRSLPFSVSANTVDLSAYESGTYLLRVLENGRMRQVRIVKH